MKIKWGVLVLLATVGSNLSARPTDSRPLYFPLPIVVNGAEVPAGIYQLTWETHNSTAIVSLSKGGAFFAGGKGTWVKHGSKYTENAVLLRVNSNGSRSLMEIRLAGSNKTIVFADPILDLGSNKVAHLKTSDD
jgi:hypothetical protein